MAGLQIPVETKGAEKNLNRLEKGFKDVGTQATKSETRVKGFRGAMTKMYSPVKKLTGMFGGLKFAIIGLMGTLALGGLAKSFLNAAKTSSGFNVRLKILLGSAEAGQEVFKRMAEYAGEVPFQFEEIMESATALSGVMKGGVDEISEWMPLVGDLAAATGMSIQDTTGQIIRMYSAGAASADMFRERGVLAMLGFQAGVSYTAQETREQLMNAWKDPTSQFAGATEALAATWAGTMSMMGDKWFAFRNMVMDSGVFDYMKIVLKELNSGLDATKDNGAMQEWAIKTAQVVTKAFGWMIKAGGAVSDMFRGWKMIWLGLKSTWHLLSFAILASVEAITRVLSDMFEGIDQKFQTFGKYLAAYGKFSGKLQYKMLGEALESGATLSEAFGGMADGAGKAADEQERLLMAANDTLVAIAEQGSGWAKASRWVDKIEAGVAALSKKKIGEFQPVQLTPEKVASKADIKTQEGFALEYGKIGKSEYQIETEALDRKVQAYKDAGVEIAKADEWRASKHEEILLRESERSEAAFRKMEEDGVDSIETLAEAMAGLGEAIDNLFVDGLTGGIMDFITGTKSAKEAFHDFAISMTRSLVEMILKQTMMNALQQATGGGGMWGGIVGGIGKLFGGKADGGSVYKGQEYVVGEKGPETFVPKTAGTIVPNGQQGGGSSINIINVTDKSLMQEYLYSEDGSKAIMNVVSSNADKVKRIIR